VLYIVIPVLEKGLSTDVWPMSEEHKSRLKASHQALVEFVLSDNEFVYELHSSQVFTTRHKQHVDICKTNADRNRRILETMDRRSIADLKNYVNCLVKTRQGHLAPLLTQNTGTQLGIYFLSLSVLLLSLHLDLRNRFKNTALAYGFSCLISLTERLICVFYKKCIR
jgi:hypothetical protein